MVVQTEPSIISKLEMMEVEERSTDPKWAADVVKYLRNGSLPEDKLLSCKVKIHSARYVLIGGVLYRRGYTEPLLKCLTNSEVEYVLKEIHEGVFGNHSGSQMLAHKAVARLPKIQLNENSEHIGKAPTKLYDVMKNGHIT
jgi:hypothetical protein